MLKLMRQSRSMGRPVPPAEATRVPGQGRVPTTPNQALGYNSAQYKALPLGSYLTRHRRHFTAIPLP